MSERANWRSSSADIGVAPEHLVAAALLVEPLGDVRPQQPHQLVVDAHPSTPSAA